MCSIIGLGKGCIMFWGRLDQNSGFHGNRKPPLTYNGENDVSTFPRLLAHLSLRLTRWAYSIPMVRRLSVIVVVHTFKLEYLWSHLANLDQVLYIASLGWGKGCIRFWGRLDQNSVSIATESSHCLIVGKTMSPPFLGCFWSDPFYTCR